MTTEAYLKSFFKITSFQILKEFIFQKLLNLRYFKKRLLLRNSFYSDIIIKKYFHKYLKIEEIRNLFYQKIIFSYSNINEKENIINILNQYCSKEVNKFLDSADKIIQKEFSIFEKTYKFKNEINWYYSFFDNFCWKLKKSEKINIRPKNTIVDVKYVWELNRHNFLPYLGIAYYLTKDEKYAIEFKNIILHWIHRNPPLFGINWFSGLEISIRLINWIFTLYFFKDSKDINNDAFFEKIFKSMFQHAYYLKYFYTRKSFNHTVGDLFGVYFFSTIFKEIRSLEQWEKKLFKQLISQIFLQTRKDGTNIEQSVNYHRFVLEFFTLFLILNFNDINKDAKSLIENMYDYLLYIIKPNNQFPLIGDNDDGKLLLLIDYNDNPFNSLINLGSILFKRGDLKYISNKYSPISILLLGTEGIELFNKLEVQIPKENIKNFPDAGYVIIRNNWSDKANYLFLDFGKFGPHYASHSHSSITSFIYCYKGKDIVIDSGTYTYNKSINERNYFRGSGAHNVLTINNKDQAKIIDRFAWKTKPKIKRRIMIDDNTLEFVGYHNGYKGFQVKRLFKTERDLNNIRILDSIFQTEPLLQENLYNINILFHFNDALDIKIENNHVKVNNDLVFKIFSSEPFDLNLKKSFYSPKYGVKIENSVLIIQIKHTIKSKNPINVKIEIESLN